ncbi:hypothetical protein DH2020_007875 [Rehmannia glutinosa]|uniref:EF-hand domain-containing protein n=1 Tax=Rehmannia glutinosa TaxID=99300 RepID=A0ABR0TZW8_REHGL
MSTFNIVHLQRIFNKLDRDGDGLVSIDELLWLLDAFSVHTNRDELELLQEIWEFEREDETMESDLRKAFRVFDLDDDGFISCEDLQNALSRLGLWDEHYGQDCRHMIGVYDTNSDGQLDFEEFKNMMFVADRSIV